MATVCLMGMHVGTSAVLHAAETFEKHDPLELSHEKPVILSEVISALKPETEVDSSVQTLESEPFDGLLQTVGLFDEEAQWTETLWNEPASNEFVYSATPMELQPCRDCPPGQCYRGVDHLGGCRDNGCPAAEWLLDAPVLATHRLLDFKCRADRVFSDSVNPRWVKINEEKVRGASCSLRGALECHFVNWRLSSMYLEGCMPEGYDLFCFIENVEHSALYQTPLQAGGVYEPGGSQQEAEAVDGESQRPITAVTLNIEPPEGTLPPDRASERFAVAGTRMHPPGIGRGWSGMSYYWNASLLNHQPLYFEDVNLERHGFSYGLCQPLVSGAKFFGTIPALPYLMVAQPPQTTRYTLGESRPGNHAHYVWERPPVSVDATAVQAAAIVGLIFLIP